MNMNMADRARWLVIAKKAHQRRLIASWRVRPMLETQAIHDDDRPVPIRPCNQKIQI
jgi:hypothetical protein